MKLIFPLIIITFLLASCETDQKSTIIVDVKNDNLKIDSITKPAEKIRVEENEKEINLSRIEKENIMVDFKDVNTDDLFTADTINIVFVSPNDIEIEKMEKELGDDFYIIADDVNYYNSLAMDFINARHVKHLNTDKRFIRFVMKDMDTVYVDTERIDSNWTLILCDGYDKPFSSSSIDIEQNFMELDE